MYYGKQKHSAGKMWFLKYEYVTFSIRILVNEFLNFGPDIVATESLEEYFDAADATKRDAEEVVVITLIAKTSASYERNRWSYKK